MAKPAFDATVNILGSLHVCEGAVAAGVKKVVFAASGGTLYGSPEEIPTRESAPQHPESPYGVAKKSTIDYLHYYREVRGLESTSLALANIYGPRQDPYGEAGVVAIFAGKLLMRERPVIYGDGSATRDYVYVDDVVDAFVRAVERGGGLTLNVGTGIETSTQHLFDHDLSIRHGRESAGYARAGRGEIRPRRDAVRGARTRDA